MADDTQNQPVAATQQEPAGNEVQTQADVLAAATPEENPLESTTGHLNPPVGDYQPDEPTQAGDSPAPVDLQSEPGAAGPDNPQAPTQQPETQVQAEEAPPAGAVREDSTGADREPQRGADAARPTRDFSVPAPKSRKLKVGDRYVVNYPRKAAVALATIKVLTNEPGRHVGVEFDSPIGQFADNGNCNGKCKPGQGLWVHPSHLLSEEEHKALVAQGEADPVRMVQEVEELEFDSETGAIKPAGADVTDGTELNDNKQAAPYSLNPADAKAAEEANAQPADATNVTESPKTA